MVEAVVDEIGDGLAFLEGEFADALTFRRRGGHASSVRRKAPLAGATIHGIRAAANFPGVDYMLGHGDNGASPPS
jgi:hypothetical protein